MATSLHLGLLGIFASFHLSAYFQDNLVSLIWYLGFLLPDVYGLQRACALSVTNL